MLGSHIRRRWTPVWLVLLLLTALSLQSAPGHARAQEDPVTRVETSAAGGRNIVKVINRVDGHRRMRGSIQVNHIPGPTVSPVNEADAFSSCVNCQSFAIALQIDLISRTATQVTPQNQAIALNYKCTNCVTVARALQYVVPVDDPTQVPENVRQLVDTMDDQLHAIAANDSLTADQVEAQINAVIAQFSDLAQSLYDQRSVTDEPTSPGAQDQSQ